MGKALKKAAIKGLKRTAEIGKGALQANIALRSVQRNKVNVARIDKLKKESMRNIMGEKAYHQYIQGTKNVVGEKNYRRLNRAHDVGIQLGDMGYQLSRGNLRGAETALERATKRGFGEQALRDAANEYEKAIGEKNYKAIHHIGHRVLNTGLDAASMGLALSTGNYEGAAKYGANALRTGMGAEELHKIKRAVRDEIGQKNYDLLNNSYKAIGGGLAIGKTLAQMNEGYDEGKKFKVIAKAYKLANLGKKLHKFATGIKKEKKVSIPPASATASTTPTNTAAPASIAKVKSTKKAGPIGKKTKQTTQ